MSLVRGIVNDAQDLIKQQLALFQAEIKEDLRKTKEATVSMAAGIGLAAVGAILLCVTLVHLLHWAFPETLPLWACYLIVGGTITALGGGLAYLGARRFASFNPLPDQSVQALKENIQWIAKPT
jgi:hypothetical protein